MTGISDQDLYNELASYTLIHPDPSFIHQYVVDAYTAQHADAGTKSVAVTFAIVGLYLAVEKKFTGKQVQHVHTLLANKQKSWPTFSIPKSRGSIVISDVLALPPGPARDKMITSWCASVWDSWKDSQQKIRSLVTEKLP